MKTCETCKNVFEITSKDRVFYERIQVPEPVHCPQCRLVRRLCERNPKHLYYRKSDFSGQMIISHYDQGVPFPVYEKKAWWGDEWDPTSYGRDFDFSRPFFEQFFELWKVVPRMALFISGDTLENSDYVNCAGYLKNCYLIGEADYDEDCYYSNRVFYSKNVVDCSNSFNNEILYECIECLGCQRLFYSQDCHQCHDSYFLKNCSSCSDCIGCINQRHKQYMIFNQQYSKEEYEAFKAVMQLETHEGVKKLRQQCDDFFKTQPHRDRIEENNQNSIGDHLYDSKNALFCFDCKDVEDCTYCVRTFNVKDSMDYTSWGDKAELIYEAISCGDNAYNLKFCANCLMSCTNLEYCQHCTASSDCFACVGLKRKKFCILNKEYSENDYKALKVRIIEHMKKTGEYGRFFPLKFASHGYNATLAMDEFPLTKEQALAAGHHWVDTEEIQSRQNTSDGHNCKTCKKTFKFIHQELAFYNQYKIPRPDQCSLCRHKARQSRRNPIQLWVRHCAKCDLPIQSSFSPDRPEPVYCKNCYMRLLY